jgi:hypothetical protein
VDCTTFECTAGDLKNLFAIMSNANTFDLGLGSVTVKPEPRWSAFAELGARYHQLRLTLFYEGYRVDQSPGRRHGTVEFFQPQSNEDIVGISVAWCFR